MKALIMLVRVIGLISIVVGAMLWTGREALLGAHIGLGMLIMLLVFVLSVVAIIKKAMVPGAIGIVLSLLLPAVGFMQLPLTFHTLRMIQVIHVMVGLCIIGLAERLYSAARAS
jgi:hypothetical protein